MKFITASIIGIALSMGSNVTFAKSPADKAKAKTTKTKAMATKTVAKKKAKKQRRFKKMFAEIDFTMGGKDAGKVKIELYFRRAPKTVENFVELAEGTKDLKAGPAKDRHGKPFYDGLTFHRVIRGFMIQGGDPDGTGTGGPGYRFEDEFHANLNHSTEGMLSMANAGPNTNGSQFFITLAPTPHLDKRHSVFGKVVDGMDIIKKIGSTATGSRDKPVEPVVMKKVTIIRK